MTDHGAEFRVDVESASGDGSIVAVGGDVDLHTAPELRDELASLIDHGADHVLLDLSEVTFLDSMGLGVLVSAKKRLAENGGTVDLVVSNPEIRRLFEITLLDEVFDVYESRAAVPNGRGG